MILDLDEISRSLSAQRAGGGTENLSNAELLVEECRRLRSQLAERPCPYDSELDATDGACPAWWRGHDHTANVFCQLANEILDGKQDSGGIASEPWESLRKRLHGLSNKSENPTPTNRIPPTDTGEFWFKPARSDHPVFLVHVAHDADSAWDIRCCACGQSYSPRDGYWLRKETEKA